MSTITGGAGSETLAGGLDADTITGAGGNDTIDGGEGLDTVVFSGNAAGYQFGFENGYLVVRDIDLADGDDGTDILRNAETLRFADRDYALAPLGEFRLNTTTTDDQSKPVMTQLADGSFVAVWESDLQDDDSGSGVYAQRFDANGIAQGAEFRVNAYTTGNQQSASVTALDSGGFVVAWESFDQDTSQEGIFARRFDAAGNALDTNDIAVNTTTTGGQYDPSVSALDGGGFVVSWYGNDSSGFGVYVRLFGSDGVATSAELPVNTETVDDQFNPSVTALGTGFVVTWTSFSQDLSQTGIYAQVLDANGDPVGSEIPVNLTTTNYQDTPTICALAGGGFVVAWESLAQDGSGDGVYARRFDATGAALDDAEIAINTTTANAQRLVSLAALEGGGFVAVWVSSLQDAGTEGVYARMFDDDGVATSVELQVNLTSTGAQTSPSVIATADGGFLVSWRSVGQDGDGDGVYARRFDAQGAPLPQRIVGTAGDDVLDLRGADDLTALGGAGNDTYVIGSSGDLVVEGAGGGTDIVRAEIDYTLGSYLEHLTLLGEVSTGTGNGLANTLTGNAKANQLNGLGGFDNLQGGSGNDTLDGGSGRDTMTGGTGNDTFIVTAGDVIKEWSGANAGKLDTVISAIDWTLAANVERLSLTGSAAVKGTGNGSGNTLAGNDAANTLSGAGGNDSISGNGGSDSLIGGTGNDTLVGGPLGDGLDTLAGGAGNDVYVVYAGDVVIEAAGSGVDTVESGSNWTLGNNLEHLTLLGSAGRGTGNSGANAISGTKGANTLAGNAGNDTLSGGSGNDQLNGGADQDTLIGGGGNDVLQGSTGNDQLTGGSGNDVFLFNSALDAATNVDRITDFTQAQDRIRLDDDVFGAFDATVSKTLLAGNIRQGAGVVAALDGDDYIIYDSSTGSLYYDADGSNAASSAIQFAQFDAAARPASLSTTDFSITG